MYSQRAQQTGRPVAFQGDINSPHVTEEERRRIKRCVSSARGRARQLQLHNGPSVLRARQCQQSRRSEHESHDSGCDDGIFATAHVNSVTCGDVPWGNPSATCSLLMRRRKANRESAARVRLKRQQLVDSLDVQARARAGSGSLLACLTFACSRVQLGPRSLVEPAVMSGHSDSCGHDGVHASVNVIVASSSAAQQM